MADCFYSVALEDDMANVQWRGHGVERSFSRLVPSHESSPHLPRPPAPARGSIETELDGLKCNCVRFLANPNKSISSCPVCFNAICHERNIKAPQPIFFMREREISEDCRSSHQMPARHANPRNHFAGIAPHRAS